MTMSSNLTHIWSVLMFVLFKSMAWGPAYQPLHHRTNSLLTHIIIDVCVVLVEWGQDFEPFVFMFHDIPAFDHTVDHYWSILMFVLIRLSGNRILNRMWLSVTIFLPLITQLIIIDVWCSGWVGAGLWAVCGGSSRHSCFWSALPRLRLEQSLTDHGAGCTRVRNFNFSDILKIFTTLFFFGNYKFFEAEYFIW